MPEESTTPDLAELAQRLVEARNARDVEALMSSFAADIDNARAAAARLAAERR
jgi:hypothetical protein